MVYILWIVQYIHLSACFVFWWVCANTICEAYRLSIGGLEFNHRSVCSASFSECLPHIVHHRTARSSERVDRLRGFIDFG